ncbi:hypothetical protein BJY00DRAFT_313612 [Aspergillus carlsbadensis]|nr:hypothetical protein BJY00DRAFT_313612 [Aspergillus carlsbadensis]
MYASAQAIENYLASVRPCQAQGSVFQETFGPHERTHEADSMRYFAGPQVQRPAIPGTAFSQNRVDGHVRDVEGSEGQTPSMSNAIGPQDSVSNYDNGSDSEESGGTTVRSLASEEIKALTMQSAGYLPRPRRSDERSNNNNNGAAVGNHDHQDDSGLYAQSPDPHVEPEYANNNSNINDRQENAISPYEVHLGNNNISNNNRQEVPRPEYYDPFGLPSSSPPFNTKSPFRHADRESTSEILTVAVNRIILSPFGSPNAEPTPDAPEETHDYRPILEAYLTELNAYLERISPWADFIRIDRLDKLKCFTSRVGYVDMTLNSVLDFKPAFFQPLDRGLLPEHLPPRCVTGPSYDMPGLPWPLWPKRGEIAAVEESAPPAHDGPTSSNSSTNGTGSRNEPPLDPGPSLIMKAVYGRKYVTYISDLVPEQKATTVQCARARQERVHEIINVTRGMKRIEGTEGTLVDFAARHMGYKTPASYLPETPTLEQAQLIQLHPAFLTTTCISPFYPNCPPPSTYASLQTPLECHGAAESLEQLTPYMVIPIRLGADPVDTAEHGDALGVGELRAAVRAILFKLNWEENKDLWFFPILIITYFPSHARILQIHPAISQTDRHPEHGHPLARLNIQYSPIFDLTAPLAPLTILATYTLARPVPWARRAARGASIPDRLQGAWRGYRPGVIGQW